MKITNIEEPQSTQTSHLEDMPELADNPLPEEPTTSYNPEVQEEEYQVSNQTDTATPSAPWDHLPYGCKTRSQEAFLHHKHKSQLRCVRQQDTYY